MMCKKNCQGEESFSMPLLHNSAFLVGVIYELGKLVGGRGVQRPGRPSRGERAGGQLPLEVPGPPRLSPKLPRARLWMR